MGESEVEQRATAAPARGQVMRRVVGGLAAVALAGVLVPVLARLTGVEAGPLATLVSLMPWVTLAALVPVVLALVARVWTLAAAAIAVAALCVAWMAPLYSATPAGGEPALRVGTFSLFNGGVDAVELVRVARERELDLLAVTELTPEIAAELREAGIEELLPHAALYPDEHKYGSGLWSARPIEEARAVPGFSAAALTAEIVLGGERTTVVVAHPESPGLRNHGDWDADTAALYALLEGLEGPVIVAGDLNTTRDHRVFRDIEGLGYVDSVDEAGSGFQPTYPEQWWDPDATGLRSRIRGPVVAIDHVMARDLGLVATEAESVGVWGSDHRGIVAVYSRP